MGQALTKSLRSLFWSFLWPLFCSFWAIFVLSFAERFLLAYYQADLLALPETIGTFYFAFLTFLSAISSGAFLCLSSARQRRDAEEFSLLLNAWVYLIFFVTILLFILWQFLLREAFFLRNSSFPAGLVSSYVTFLGFSLWPATGLYVLLTVWQLQGRMILWSFWFPAKLFFKLLFSVLFFHLLPLEQAVMALAYSTLLSDSLVFVLALVVFFRKSFFSWIWFRWPSFFSLYQISRLSLISSFSTLIWSLGQAFFWFNLHSLGRNLSSSYALSLPFSDVPLGLAWTLSTLLGVLFFRSPKERTRELWRFFLMAALGLGFLFQSLLFFVVFFLQEAFFSFLPTSSWEFLKELPWILLWTSLPRMAVLLFFEKLWYSQELLRLFLLRCLELLFLVLSFYFFRPMMRTVEDIHLFWGLFACFSLIFFLPWKRWYLNLNSGINMKKIKNSFRG